MKRPGNIHGINLNNYDAAPGITFGTGKGEPAMTVTKNRQTNDTILRMAKAAFPDRRVSDIKELDDGFLDGITGSYHDSEGYFAADQNPEAFEQFDAEFPPKEKLKLPGQLF